MQTPELQITPQILNLIATIEEFKGRWTALKTLAPDRLNALRQVATIESIGSSTRIEGVKLSDQEIEHLLKGLDTHSFRSRDEEEVAGYAAAMELIFESHSDITLSENHIKQLHSELLKYSSKDTRHRGEYKKFPNHVEAFDATGHSLGVVFETVAPFDTPQVMMELVAWTNTTLGEKTWHPLLVIAHFTVSFLAIHPFQDGNGRLSRILTTLLLLQQGYEYVPYSSLERIVEENKESYYLALRKTQSSLSEGKTLSDSWLVFFLTCLIQQINVLERKIDQAKATQKLPKLSEDLLQITKDQGRITVKEAGDIIGANRNTIKHHLKTLVNDGYLVQHGEGKGTWYAIASS